VAGVLVADCGAGLVAPHGAADLVFGAPDNAPQGMYLTDHELVFRPKPGFEGTMRSLGYRVPLRFDAEWGLRGGGIEPKADAPRWLAAGDSFTLSPQVVESDTFAARLAAGQGVEVLNAGVDGYSTWQALERYRQLDEALSLDGVLLTFFLGNDFEDNRRFRTEVDRARARPEGQPIQRQPVPALTAFLRKNSYLYGQWLVRGRVAALANPNNPERQRWASELELFTTAGERRRNGVRGETERALRALSNETRARGDALVVAIAPPAFVVDTDRVAPTFSLVGLDPAQADLHAPGQMLADILRRMNIAACDLVGPLEAARASGSAPLYFTYDGHWTPAGHAVVADVLGPCMPGGAR
jgi:hypothetical protein